MTTATKKAMYRVYLLNVQTIGSYCGYGEGRTHEEAVKDALRKAREMGHTEARYDAQSGQVTFCGGVNC